MFQTCLESKLTNDWKYWFLVAATRKMCCFISFCHTNAKAQRRHLHHCIYLLPQPTTWQRTFPLQSSSERRAEGHGASGWDPPLCPLGESALGWALRQTWWARRLGNGMSSGGCRGKRCGKTVQKTTKKNNSGGMSMHHSTVHQGFVCMCVRV